MKVLLPALALLAVSSTTRADVSVQPPITVQPACHAQPATEPAGYANVVRDKLAWPGCLVAFDDLWMDLVDSSHEYWRGGDTDGHAVLAYYNQGASNGKLLVFLAGEPASTKTYTAFAQRAARDGYRAIVLPYWNAPLDDDDATIDWPNDNLGASSYQCNALFSPDSCITSMYDYSTRGTPIPLSWVGIGRFSPPGGGGGAAQDSIAQRLKATLAFLDASFPAQGWGAFVDANDNIRWGETVVAGHSHGTSNTARLAHLHALHGAIFLEGPNDYYGAEKLPHSPSFLAAGATSGSRMWLLDNTSDSDRLPRVKLNIDAMGLGTVGSAGKQIDSTTSFANVTAHRLWAHSIDDGANGTPASCDAHMSTGTGCGGYFNAAWDYLLEQAAL